MAVPKLSKADNRRIEKALKHFEKNRHQFDNLAQALMTNLSNDPKLSQYIHFIKFRIKDLDSLRKKLEKKTIERKSALKNNQGQIPDQIDANNIFYSINDLAGIRLIHLHTQQLEVIHKLILGILDEQQYALLEKPTGSCWDAEYRKIYSDLEIDTRETDGYSSIHYVIQPNTKTEISCELQVRTLTDEVWGEVSHRVNYPEASPSKICDQQLKTLARFTTGCTRLVDTIFATDAEARDQ